MTGGSDRTRQSVLKQLEDGSPRAATGGDGPSGERHAIGLTPEADPAAIEALEAGGAATTVDLGHVGTVVAGEFSAATRRRLEAHDRVRYVEPDRPPEGFEAVGADPFDLGGTVGAHPGSGDDVAVGDDQAADGSASTGASGSQTLPWNVDRIDADVLHEAGLTGAGATVADVSTGIDDDHPDLPEPVDGEAYVACDGSNGNDCTYDWSDDNDFGTKMGGVAAARDNAEGVVGVGPDLDLLAVKAIDSNGSGSFSDLADGIRWATDNGADVVNLSIGASSGSSTLEDACQYAYDNGVVLVGATGNGGPCTDCVAYPAAYQEVIAVSATDENDDYDETSGTGPEVELAAPGVDIETTVANDTNDYETESRPAYASPTVAATAALVKAETELSDNEAIRDHLKATAADLGLPSEEQGSGLVDASNAVLLDELWRFDAGARYQFCSPALANDRVYVGSLDGTFYALDRASGSVVWSFDREGALADSSPALANDRVYVGSGGGTVYAFDATADTATVDWSVGTDSAVVSSPTIDGDTVYVGSNGGDVLALDDAAGGTETWRTDVGGPVYAAPAVDGSSVYVTTVDGAVVALDAGTGAEQWRYHTGTPLGHGAPTAANGLVYVAAADVYALDPTNGGTPDWQESYGGASESSPTYDADNGQVLVGSADGAVYAMDADAGTVNWSADAGSPVGSPPALAGGWVLVGSTSGGTHLFETEDGTALAQRDVGRVAARPAVDGDRGVVSTWDGTLVASRHVRP
jgi:subtilisin